MTDEVTPLAAPSYIRANGPFDTIEDLLAAKLIKSPLEPWRTWFLAHGVDAVEPGEGSSFNDIGLMCDAAAQGPRPSAPSLSDALGTTPMVPDAAGAKKGAGTYDTLTGTPLQR